MCDFRTSDYVECIDDRQSGKQFRTMPELGRLYTVQAVRSVGGRHRVRLNELAPDCYRGGACACGDCGWDAARFRRVYRPEAKNIAALRALLENPVGLPID